MTTASLYRMVDADHPWLLLREVNDFGLRALDLVPPPIRFWSRGDTTPPALRMAVDAARAQPMEEPGALLEALPEGDNWHAQTSRTQSRLLAWFLLCEDPQRRLDAQDIAVLAHQASLVQHVLQDENLKRVLIADEVGLGKTIEAALLVRELLQRNPRLRVLYLAPARLVSNVRREMDRLGLNFRRWVADGDHDARADLSDPLVIASIHRAIGSRHADTFAQRAWDVVVVDECHHLSAWAPGGGNATRNYRLVEDVRQRIPESGRLILLSGTPHQGHRDRFDNLLRLLARDGEEQSAYAGRVIYRLKDDVRDWDGNPLFPRRRVNQAVVLDLGQAHRDWLEQIHRFFVPDELAASPEARRRAVGWRCGQALQWATSSVEAGLGYMVRQAIRADWDLRADALQSAIQAIRPYRNGAPNEDPAALLERMRREIGVQDESGDIEDIDDGYEDAGRDRDWCRDEALLAEVLNAGVSLLAKDRDYKWRELHERILRPAGDEKVVLFAQPIETVTALAGYIERTIGFRPALIIGQQKEEERQREIQRFWDPVGPRYLVSSRAGGEGINLQVARRLVHVDVPWNPMELEQRVGRVHRFMSQRTVLVDTLVVKDSREEDMYRIARQKLEQIAQDLSVDNDRFEALYARVIALVPPEELQNVLTESAVGPLSDENRRQIAELVQQGFRTWEAFHTRFTEQQHRIQRLDPGLVTWDDLIRLAVEHLKAEETDTVRCMTFTSDEGGVVDQRPIRGLRLKDGLYACGDYGGLPLRDEGGAPVRRFGLNVPPVPELLRRLAFLEQPSGAAHVRWPQEIGAPPVALPFGVLIYAQVTLRLGDGQAEEIGTQLRTYLITTHGEPREMAGEERERVLRAILRGRVRREPDSDLALIAAVRRNCTQLVDVLRQPSSEDIAQRRRHAVAPLVAAIVS